MLGIWLPIGAIVFAAFPSTPNYQLNSYGFGSGGTANSTTSNYALEGISGEISGSPSSTATYSVKPGFIQTQQAHVPKVSAFDNGSGTYYNKLHFVIDQQSNPSDAQYAVSISTDNFVSNVNYVKNDLTIGASLALTDYQTYSTWGGASGANIIGLLPDTTYYLRIKATQGKYTESAYGPIASATTTNPHLSFSVSTNSENLGSLIAGSVVSSPSTVDVDFDTNAASGGDVYINGKNTGLFSTQASYTIPSSTGDLSVLARGFGAQVTATGATTGTFTKVSPYNGTLNNVGITDTTIRRIITSAGPIVGGTGSISIKAKAAASDKAADDYTETITLLASASF
ncbi:MAG: hypothetical protein AAB436_04920 [Patescibacteria group bacterium]